MQVSAMKAPSASTEGSESAGSRPTLQRFVLCHWLQCTLTALLLIVYGAGVLRPVCHDEISCERGERTSVDVRDSYVSVSLIRQVQPSLAMREVHFHHLGLHFIRMPFADRWRWPCSDAELAAAAAKPAIATIVAIQFWLPITVLWLPVFVARTFGVLRGCWRRRYQRCERCGYSIRGLPGKRCPECGLE